MDQKKDFPGGSDSKASAYSAGDPGLIHGLGISPGEGNGTPLQYSCLENTTDGGAWQATVHGVTKSRTRLHFLLSSSHRWRRLTQVWFQVGGELIRSSPGYGEGIWGYRESLKY